jgi:hypothetical protein
MNEHAKKIWQTWLDGEDVVQFHAGGRWQDANPNEYASFHQPQCMENHWRIKPKPETEFLRYRCWVERTKDGSLVVHAMQLNDDSVGERNFRMKMIESLPSFVCWEGKDRVAKVEVEE